HVDDAPRLVEALRTSADPTYRGILALAVGFHGSGEALDALLSVLEHDRALPEARASAFAAVGILVEDGPALLIGELAHGSWRATQPDWQLGLWQHLF
ncbi:MAG TPA: hypothetical protein VJP77_08845, partial [Planctomycetota bacterium]|nr:hypothetical protein [Planctomycetota bacterium]